MDTKKYRVVGTEAEAEGKLVLGVVIYQLTWERNKELLFEHGIEHIGWVVRDEPDEPKEGPWS